jgi:hypothetical protein
LKTGLRFLKERQHTRLLVGPFDGCVKGFRFDGERHAASSRMVVGQDCDGASSLDE